MHKILHLLSLPLRRYWLFMAVLYAVGICVTYGTLPKWRGAMIYEFAYEELFFDTCLLACLLCFVPRQWKVRKWTLPLSAIVTTLIYIVVYALAFIDIHCFTAYGNTINPTMLLLVQETNSNEAMEFFAGIDWQTLLFGKYGGSLCLILIAQLAITFLPGFLKKRRNLWSKCLQISKCLQTKKYSPKRIQSRTPWRNILLCLLSLIFYAFFIYTAVLTLYNKRNFYRLMSLPTIGAMEKHFNMPDEAKAHLYQPVYQLLYSVRANQLTEQQITILRDNLHKTKVDSCDFRVPDIVLIIGESYNKHHSQLFGYDKPTTPRQCRRKNRGELIPFSDVVAPWNLTSFCFKNMLSFNALGEEGDWCDHSLFPAVFRKAGYKVFFLTNQFLPKTTDAVFDVSGGFFLNDDSLSHAQFDVRNHKLYTLDVGLLAEYDSIQSQRTEHNLTIFHLYGQHMLYKKRYPSSRARWTRDDYNRPDLNSKNRQTMAEYDNATLYNDSIVNAILTRFEDKDAVVICLPDHAEEIYGNKYCKFGRIHSNDIDLDIAREEYELPVWIWGSRKFRRQHWQTWRQIRAAKDLPWMTDQLPHILAYLAGIHTREYRPDLNPLDREHYNTNRPRLMKAVVDYNKLKKQ